MRTQASNERWPINFSFVIPGVLAACAAPSLQDAQAIAAMNTFRTIVDLREHTYPTGVTNVFQRAGIATMHIPVNDFDPPTQKQMEAFCRILVPSFSLSAPSVPSIAQQPHQRQAAAAPSAGAADDGAHFFALGSSSECSGIDATTATQQRSRLPVLVHCRQGIGRTGTMLAAAVALYATLDTPEGQRLAADIEDVWLRVQEHHHAAAAAACNSKVVTFVRWVRGGMAMEVMEQVRAAVAFERLVAAQQQQQHKQVDPADEGARTPQSKGQATTPWLTCDGTCAVS